MATVNQIEKLIGILKMLPIEKNDVLATVKKSDRGFIKDLEPIESYAMINAEYIDFKKLLMITALRLRELHHTYKDISYELQKNVDEDFKKIVKLSRSYIKPEDRIRFFCKIYMFNGEKGKVTPSNGILKTSGLIYEEELDKNELLYNVKRFLEIKDYMPDVEIKDIENLLNIILEDTEIAGNVSFSMLENTLLLQGETEEELNKIFKSLHQQETWILPNSIKDKIDSEIYNKVFKERIGIIKQLVNFDKYLLFCIEKINEKLDNNEELRKDEIEFINNAEVLLENADSKNNIEIRDDEQYRKTEAYKFLSRINLATREYYTEEQIKTGERLLQDTNGYENYLEKSQLIKLAKIEGNLIYLAQNGKLSNRDITKVLKETNISETALVELYSNNTITLEQLEKYAQSKNMDINKMKERIRQKIDFDLDKVDINNKEQWELLSQEEKLQLITSEIEQGNVDIIKQLAQDELEELRNIYNAERIAQLYKEIYINKKLDSKEEYEKNIKIYNELGIEDKEEIIALLEEEFSNEMLINLYNDNLINIELLESYGEKELVVVAFEQGKIKESDINKVIQSCPIKLTEEQVIEFYRKGLISTKEGLDLYLQNKISLDSLKILNEIAPEEEKVSQYLSQEEVVKLYLQAKRNRKNQDDQIRYKRYALSYQTLKKEPLEIEKMKKEKKLFTQEDILNLYQDNMISIQTLIGLGGTELAKKLAIAGELRPNDSNKLFKIMNIVEILEKMGMDNERKLMLIYNSIEDKKTRDKLIKKYVQGYNGTKNKYTIQKETHNKMEDIDKKEHGDVTVMDPYERWNFYKSLDKNYSPRYLDGFLIMTLNNKQKTIIEKLYTKSGTTADGIATFVLDTDRFIEIEDELIENNSVDISIVRKIAKEEPGIAFKITHHRPSIDNEGNEKNSYAKRILRAIEPQIEELRAYRYTPEEEKNIEECARRMEASRGEI